MSWTEFGSASARCVAVGLTVFIVGCQTLTTPPGPAPTLAGGLTMAVSDSIPLELLTSDSRRLSADAIRQLEQGHFKAASKLFNRALALSPASSQLHFMNALTYHLIAETGDENKREMAEEGYRLAVRFDRSNWLAYYFLGLLELDRRRFEVAQQWLSEALLFNSDDVEILYAMFVASYYSQDVETAAAIMAQLSSHEPDSERVMRGSALINAAVGDHAQAQLELERYASVEAATSRVSELRQRIEDWADLHRNVQQVALTTGSADTTAETRTNALGTARSALQSESNIGNIPSIDPNASNETLPVPADSSILLTAQTETAEGEAPVEEVPNEERMVIVDIVIVRTEENLIESRGINLLRNLQLGFGSVTGGTAAFSSLKERAKTHDQVLDATDPWSTTRTITSLVTIPALTYSLNIANSLSERNEVLARPTLVARHGQQSEFFSGVEINAAATSGGDGSSVSIEKEVGVRLAVTPEFLAGDRLNLTVTAERTFLQAPTDDVQFSFRIETTKTTVTANVTMDIGDTLILSGLSEKETERTRSGVPFLQDLPGIQYLFSERTSTDFQKSVLILITPRAPNFVYQDSQSRTGGATGNGLPQFKSRHSDWFKPYPNWASVFHHMQSNTLYREFRTGDVTLERWQSSGHLQNRI